MLTHLTARRVTGAVALVATALALVACSNTTSEADAGSTPPEETTSLSGELTIYAAASLKASFDEIATAFEAENPGVTVNPIVYDGSSTLVTQLSEGAPADIFASADEANMTKAVDAALITADDAVLFATNTLVIAVPAGNPADVQSPEDFTRGDVTLVLCAVEVPCGAASQKLLTNWGVEAAPASFEQNVTAVLTKVAADEADAGLVYRTDVQGRDDVEGIVPDGAENVVNRYPITALTASANPDAAAAFVAFVTGERARAILAAHGFGAP
jgi:molybdate transport system substrate-binding protein